MTTKPINLPVRWLCPILLVLATGGLQAGVESGVTNVPEGELTNGLRILKPAVRWVAAPLKPSSLPKAEQSVLLGRSAFMALGDGTGAVQKVYLPLEDGGFEISGSARRLNRPIVHGQNRIWTGDVPLFRMDTVTGNGSYVPERVFPLWPRPDATAGNVNPCMGVLRLGVPGADGKTNWFDQLPATTAIFRPGYTDYRIADPAGKWKATVAIAPALDFHGLICRVEFDREMPLLWQYGGIFWSPSETNQNHLEPGERVVRITEPNLPDGLVLAGCDAPGEFRAIGGASGPQAEFKANPGRRTYHVVATWGVIQCDSNRVAAALKRLETPATLGWSGGAEPLKQLWFDCYIKRALEPEKHFQQLLAGAEDELGRTRAWWDARRAEFQIHTPDPHLNALINWARCISEYHRQGPGLVLGGQIWQMYSHISTGWYGKQWGGDHEALEQCLRLYGAMQDTNGFIRWVSPSLVAFPAENNVPYWVDQVWWHYAWTGDRQFVRDLWPQVRQATAWLRGHNDPDGDGLYRDWYEYWNCDSNGKGPKAAAPSAMAWTMFDRAARLAVVAEDATAAQEYRAAADKIHEAIFRELWRPDEGRLGSIGADGIWRGHPQTWEEYLAINAGLLAPDQGRSAMRWVAAHYGFEPQPGVHLLSCSDWWPIRWSVQWVPTGDTCLAALGGMKCGDIDLWWPYLKTVVLSAFRSEFPGISMGISNAGAGGGDREDVDSDDPHLQVVVRGLFGIEPALADKRMAICPAFPSEWSSASIRTPDVSYEYHRAGGGATFHIRTPRPVAKRVRANASGPEVVTAAETESQVTLRLGANPPPPPAEPAPILAEQQPPPAPRPLAATEQKRQVLLDLASACNLTLEKLTSTRFTFDYSDYPAPLSQWWGNPALTTPPFPRVIQAANGVCFLTSGCPPDAPDHAPKALLALSSWRPYPLPAGVVIPIGLRCERLWFLLQNYVHPMKNYIPNGEIVLAYADGRREVKSLVPPFNLDCYFQHFSREGVAVAFGQLKKAPAGWTPIHAAFSMAHADALEIGCDPAVVLESVELRATCSEGVIGLAGLTALAAGK